MQLTQEILDRFVGNGSQLLVQNPHDHRLRNQGKIRNAVIAGGDLFVAFAWRAAFTRTKWRLTQLPNAEVYPMSESDLIEFEDGHLRVTIYVEDVDMCNLYFFPPGHKQLVNATPLLD